MQPLAVDAALLRVALAGDVRLAVGRELMVRVASLTAEGRGVLSLAGLLLEAELPGNVRSGDELRLQVRELTPDRVVLAIHDDAAVAAAPAPLESPRVALPGGGHVCVTEREAERAPSGGDRAHAVTLRYDAPALGAVDLRLVLSAGALAVTVAVAPGAYAAADDQAGRLRADLTAATERPATVTVVARREPVEVFA